MGYSCYWFHLQCLGYVRTVMYLWIKVIKVKAHLQKSELSHRSGWDLEQPEEDHRSCSFQCKGLSTDAFASRNRRCEHLTKSRQAHTLVSWVTAESHLDLWLDSSAKGRMQEWGEQVRVFQSKIIREQDPCLAQGVQVPGKLSCLWHVYNQTVCI